MKFCEFVLAVTHAHKDWCGSDAALLVKDGVVTYIGQQSGLYTYDTPVVNMLQNLGLGKVSESYLYCSYKPSEMDIGMACMRSVSQIFFVEGGIVKSLTLNDETGPALAAVAGHGQFALTKRTDLNAAIENPGGATRWSNTSWVANWYNWLDGNARFLLEATVTFLKSYRLNSTKAYKSRPAENITTLQGVLKHGLTGLTQPSPIVGPARDKFFMLGALALVGRSLSTTKGREGTAPGGHNIGALLVNSNNQTIAWGINMMKLNGTFHAETAMVLAYLRRNNRTTLPDGCRLYSSLKPCHMCSGFIATVAKKITVLVGQQDPKISNSALAMGRGTEVTETPVANSPDIRSALNRSQWNLGDVLEDLIARSGQSAVPFLYSDAAAKFFTELRTRPDTMQKVVKELCHPAPLTIVPARVPASSNRLHLDLAGVTQPRTPILLNSYRGGSTPAPNFGALQRQGGPGHSRQPTPLHTRIRS
jgi:tRNA(Arg) A34 adenosine deaminase TadA